MKTDELTAMLAAQALPVDPRSVQRRLSNYLLPGILLATAIMVALFKIRPDIDDATMLPMFWVKLLLPMAAAWASLSLVMRLARPGIPPGRMLKIIFPALLGFIWLLALVSLMQAEPGARQELIFGRTWLKCIFLIPFLALPIFVAVFGMLRGLAPTRLTLAGAAGGLFAGTASAAIYAVHCHELSAPFIGIWYVIGMLIPAAVGALLGRQLLKW